MSFSGAAGGALTGAGIGSAFGPLGAGLGGLLGGVGGLLGFGKSKKPKLKDYSPYSSQQRALMDQFGADLGPLAGLAKQDLAGILGNDPNSLRAFEDPYLKQFNEEIIPNIAERFSGLGAQRSSAFGQALAQGGQDLETRLASLRSQLKQNALQSLLQFGQFGMQQQVSPYIRQGTPGLFDSLAGSAGQIAGNVFSQPDFLKRYWG